MTSDSFQIYVLKIHVSVINMTSNLQSIISITNQTFLLNSSIGIEHKLILSENFENCFFYGFMYDVVLPVKNPSSKCAFYLANIANRVSKYFF